jgi:uncharacterized membrane protein YfcA
VAAAVGAAAGVAGVVGGVVASPLVVAARRHPPRAAPRQSMSPVRLAPHRL